MKIKLLKVNQYLQASALHRFKTYLSIRLHQVASPYFDAMILLKINFFNRFYKDYVEFKHYLYDIIKLVTPGRSLSDENNFKKNENQIAWKGNKKA